MEVRDSAKKPRGDDGDEDATMKMTTSIFQTRLKYPVLDVGHIHDNSRGNHGNMQSAGIDDVESIPTYCWGHHSTNMYM